MSELFLENLDAVKVFLGRCKGVALVKRGHNDPHLCFLILTEDDGNWFVSISGTSSYWLEDLQDVLEEARSWLKRNAVQDGEYGYKCK